MPDTTFYQEKQIAEFVELIKRFNALRLQLKDLHQRRYAAGFIDPAMYTEQMLANAGIGHLTTDQLQAANDSLVNMILWVENPASDPTQNNIAPINHILRVIP